MKIHSFKMRVTPEQAKIVQEFLFSKGYSWLGKPNTTIVDMTSCPYLYFNQNGKDGELSRGFLLSHFKNPKVKLITFKDFEKLYMQEEKALRYNTDKLHWSLVDFKSLEPLVRVLEYGTKKYSKDNWKKGLDTTEVLESLSRHLFSLMAGEEIDSESQLPHIGHIMANAMFYEYMINKYNGL